MTGQFLRLSLALTVSGAALTIHGSGLAQIAPTEVHENVVDEFGVERTTGQFVWSSGKIIGIGNENARLPIYVNDEAINPACAPFERF